MTKRSKRLRKKLFLDEFAVLGFELSFGFNDADIASTDEFYDNFFDLLNSIQLIAGGGINDGRAVFFICSAGRYASPNEEDIKIMMGWLKEYPGVFEVVAGELVDANYF